MNYIVLGRFQPLHNGHALLIEKALEIASENDKVTVAIGSASCQMEPRNPWTGHERKEMIEAWSSIVEVVLIDDINDPPNWVEHASKFHGEGTLVTSDKETAERSKTEHILQDPEREHATYGSFRFVLDQNISIFL